MSPKDYVVSVLHPYREKDKKTGENKYSSPFKAKKIDKEWVPPIIPVTRDSAS